MKPIDFVSTTYPNGWAQDEFDQSAAEANGFIRVGYCQIEKVEVWRTPAGEFRGLDWQPQQTGGHRFSVTLYDGPLSLEC